MHFVSCKPRHPFAFGGVSKCFIGLKHFMRIHDEVRLAPDLPLIAPTTMYGAG
jgi:hypothetical protein